jgi:hypothetical protein
MESATQSTHHSNKYDLCIMFCSKLHQVFVSLLGWGGIGVMLV